ncbi:MAG TPA: S-methyl-5-thioribose-1-phosphate isomerase [Pseudomonadales bacterium]
MTARAPEPIRWRDQHLELMDQTRLPEHAVYEPQTSLESVYDAIRQLKVRGAPAIGIAAAYGLVVAMQPHRGAGGDDFMRALLGAAKRLRSARPTAVNLGWAVDRVVAAAQRPGDGAARYALIAAEAEAIHAEDRRMCRAIGEAGRDLIAPGCGVLTHCNAGALAVSELGTATAPMYLAHDEGVEFRVYVGETRPLLQGSRLTAWELTHAGLDVTLICDTMVARLMAEGAIDLVLVGTDRVTRNGDVVNKIGTSAIAILARHYGIAFYVACPSSTFDPATPTGASVPIEERDGDEVRTVFGHATAPRGVKVRNPAFDVTPAELVTGFVTDAGLLAPPFERSLLRLSPR